VNLDFDFDHEIVTEFGVGQNIDTGEEFVAIPVDANVQSALLEMVFATRDAMDRFGDDISEYEPSETTGGTKYLTTTLGNPLAGQVQLIHSAENLQVRPGGLEAPANIFCYFVRLSDHRGKRLTGVRRATQFKGVLKSQLLRFLNDSMRLVDEDVFKLDRDFDLLVDETTIHILRPNGFEAIGRLQEAILSAVAENVSAIAIELPFIDFASIGEYASGHSRAARSLAALRSSGRSAGIDRVALCDICTKTGVELIEVDGKIGVGPEQVTAFLEVLDRRRYQLLLVPDVPESYRATSRQSVR
jgi:hypothetical protein